MVEGATVAPSAVIRGINCEIAPAGAGRSWRLIVSAAGAVGGDCGAAQDGMGLMIGETDSIVRFWSSSMLSGSGMPWQGRGTIALARRKDVQPTHAAREFRETLLAHIRSEAASGSLPAGVESLLR